MKWERNLTIRYKKVLKRNKKLFTYFLVSSIFIICNIFTFIDAFASGGNDKWRIVALGSSFLMECLGFLYCVIQDINNAIKEAPSRFIFDNGSTGIPFVDREELLESIIHESVKRIQDNNFYYTRNIRYGERNGKTSFSKKLCYEIQRIKDKDENAVKVSCPKFYKQIGNIFYINYTNYSDSFATRIKTEFTYIKGKKNIVVVDNSYDNLCLWTDDLADRDVFFIFLNFNANSDDALFFADDKIKELLIRLQTIPAFSSISAEKTEEEISMIASKLGSISNNNIGTIIDLLLSNEFSILLETDKQFVDFYFAIKHGKYQEAALLYRKIPTPPIKQEILRYKLKFEQANLTHFLGDYNTAYKDLELLLAEICNDQKFIKSSIGEFLYTDIVLLQAHVKKHQGAFDDAASILMNVTENYRSIPWLRSHFSIDILRMNELIQPTYDWDNLLDNLYLKMEAFKEKRKIRNSDYYFYEAYYPIVCFYKNKFNKGMIPELIKIEDQAISYYEKEERRYLTNCYFIKAELYRIVRDWKNAEEFYSRCYNIFCHNGDKDILYLVAIACKCLQRFEKIQLNIPFDWDSAIEDCKKREGYDFHNRLISQMELACIDKEVCKHWFQHYRVTINPIP